MKKYDLICVGMALIDSIIKGFNPEPVSVSGYQAISSSLNVGGEAVNEAIAASKLGLKTRIMCCLGEDVAGEIVKDTLKKHSVDTELIVKSPQTPITTMFVKEDGSRKSIINEAHVYNFHPEKYTNVLIDAKVLILGSLFRAPFDEPSIINSVLTAAQKADQIVIADTKPPRSKNLKLNDIADSLSKIDYITPNEDEARFFTNEEDPSKMADVFLNYGVKNVIIKLGSKGCYFKNLKDEYTIPGYKIKAVDATGAGDNFVAGFAAEILRSSTIKEALLFANACGAICTTEVGAGTALKNRQQVLEWLDSNEYRED